MAISGLPLEFERKVLLTCEAVVGGERLEVRTECLEAVWNDPAAREAIERSVREALMWRILEHWTPVIKVRR